MSLATSSTAFSPAPSLATSAAVAVDVSGDVPDDAEMVGVLVGPAGPPEDLGLDRRHLDAAGFAAEAGSVHVLLSEHGVLHAVVGVGADGDAAALRDAAGAFGRVSGTRARLAIVVPDLGAVPPGDAVQAVVEGVLMSRYTYDALRAEPKGAAPSAVTVVAGDAGESGRAAAERGRAHAAATMLARDLANTPHSHLTASTLATLAEALGPPRGLTVDVFGKEELIAMGCGGILGVNAGSAEPPRLIKLTYEPAGSATGHLAIVGKGIMYDSGGLSLKPGDEVHAQMKNDMTGAAAALAAMCVLQSVGCRAKVTAFLCCTDNMPSGTAMALGDVITMRNGTTVEIINTDAEGRLVMADGLVLATEEGADAIVDIATLTGACMRALGKEIAGVMGTSPALIDQIEVAADAVDEPVWQLPLSKQRYRDELLSPIADLKNLGSANGGAIHAGMFLAEFVGDTPFAHIDIAGVAQTPKDVSWHTVGCSGFGARLLVEVATRFQVPGA